MCCGEETQGADTKIGALFSCFYLLSPEREIMVSHCSASENIHYFSHFPPACVFYLCMNNQVVLCQAIGIN